VIVIRRDALKLSAPVMFRLATRLAVSGRATVRSPMIPTHLIAADADGHLKLGDV
jgi:hypothetical protein